MTATDPPAPAGGPRRRRPAGVAARTRTLRWALAVATVIGAVVAVLAGWLEVCDSADVCRPPRVGDAVTLALGAVVLLLLAPDLSEGSVAGLVSVRSRLAEQEDRLAALDARLTATQTLLSTTAAVGGGAVVNVVSGVGTGAFAVAVDAGDRTEPAAVLAGGVPSPDAPAAPAEGAAPASAPPPRADPARDQSRYLAGELLMAHLGDLGAGLLDGANLRLYLPSEGGAELVPALHPASEHGHEDVWRPGEGAVGRAWQSAGIVVLEGADVLADVADLPAGRRQRYARLEAVVATPVLNAAGAPIGVLSASTTDPAFGLASGDALEELVAAGEVVARVLVDLLGWADDGPSPAAPPRPATPGAPAAPSAPSPPPGAPGARPAAPGAPPGPRANTVLDPLPPSPGGTSPGGGQ